jgi:hypothetical protein
MEVCQGPNWGCSAKGEKITTATTCTQQGIRFHFSSEQDYKVALNYFKFNEKESYTYQTAERIVRNVLPMLRQK